GRYPAKGWLARDRATLGAWMVPGMRRTAQNQQPRPGLGRSVEGGFSKTARLGPQRGRVIRMAPAEAGPEISKVCAGIAIMIARPNTPGPPEPRHDAASAPAVRARHPRLLDLEDRLRAEHDPAAGDQVIRLGVDLAAVA